MIGFTCEKYSQYNNYNWDLLYHDVAQLDPMMFFQTFLNDNSSTTTTSATAKTADEIYAIYFTLCIKHPTETEYKVRIGQMIESLWKQHYIRTHSMSMAPIGEAGLIGSPDKPNDSWETFSNDIDALGVKINRVSGVQDLYLRHIMLSVNQPNNTEQAMRVTKILRIMLKNDYKQTKVYIGHCGKNKRLQLDGSFI